MAVISMVALSTPSRIEAASHDPSAAQTSIRQYFRSLDERSGSPSADRRTDRLVVAFAALDGGETTAVAYLVGRDWCGSGGCTTFVLERVRGDWHVVTRITISRPPITVLPTTSHGWRDIAVRVSGGGIVKGYEAELPFDGKSYATNPTMPPAKRAGPAQGTVIIGSMDEATPLF